MLLAAAARRWDVDIASLATSGDGAVTGPGGRRLTYGELATEAGALAVPSDPVLASSEGSFRWIGKDLAMALQHDNYLNHPSLIVDDYLRATEELLAFEAVP